MWAFQRTHHGTPEIQDGGDPPSWILMPKCKKDLANSYRQQIARQLRTQYADGIYRLKYYTVTLKSRLRVTQGHWKRNHWIDHTRLHDLVVVELFDGEYYCDLEMWVRGHWRSLKVVTFETLGKVSYSTSNYGRMSPFWRYSASKNDLEIWVWSPSRSLKMTRFDRPCMTFSSSSSSSSPFINKLTCTTHLQ